MDIPMSSFIIFAVGYLILWLGIKFLAEPIGGVDDPGWFRSAIWAIVIWFVSTAASIFMLSAITG